MKIQSRFKWVLVLSLITLILGLFLLGTGVAAAIYQFNEKVSQAGKVTGLTIFDLSVKLIMLGFMGCGLFILFGLIKLIVAGKEHIRRLPSQLDRVESLLTKTSEDITDLQQLAQLSDRAKSLIFREEELEAIRETIHHDLMKQDYETAGAIIEQVESEFGYKDEAQRLRDEVTTARKATFDEKIDASINRIQEILKTHDWARALRESKRFMQLFPENAKIQALPQRIADSRMKHKSSMLQEYGEAVRKNDIDLGVELLKKLDVYLTPQEADALKESARGVFRAKLHQLGVQFAICVNDQRWSEAVETGQEIIEEFPNSRMANEVQQKLEVLKNKASDTVITE